MRKYLTIMIVLFLTLFMVGCENSVNPINSDNPTTSIAQSENVAKIGAKPFVGEQSNLVAKKGPKPPKPLKPNKWYVPGDFGTIQEAIDAVEVVDGDKIEVGEGNYYGAFITKEVEIKGKKNKTIINDGPMHPAGLTMGFRFLTGSDNSKISNLDFTVDLAIMNGDAVDNIEIKNNNFYNTIQAVSNWRGSGWKIHHNTITDLRTRNGGGIGILVADFSGGIVENNKVEHNKINGTLFVDPADGGGYAGSGIVLYADFRWGWAGASEIKNNLVKYNKVSLNSDTPEVVDVVGFELTDTRDDESLNVIFDNLVTKNDLRGTEESISLTPANLGDYNEITKNKVN